MKGQTSFLEEIIVDNFAGGGGASTGIELATGRPVTIAINHDPAAILMHKTNHPHTTHLQASVWDVDPVEVCAGRPVGLAWFSPDCKHFSKAKGSALVDRNIRGLAWIVLRWAGTVRPRVIILENVEEFQTWGPVRKGKPEKSKRGQTFKKWLGQLRELGYTVDFKELVAADYGAPTSRKRFVLIARCDGKPIVWPERTHAPKDSEEVRTGRCKPWRAAAEIIDWTQPMYSIFASKEEIKQKHGVNAVRPLAENTLRRIIRGVDKFTIKSGKPFIVECNHGGDGHIRNVHEPVNTLTAKYTGGVVQPVMAPVTFSNTGGSVGSPASEPVHTIRTAGGQILAAANLIHYHTEQSEAARVSGLPEALPTVDASNRYGIVSAHLTEYYGNGNPLDIGTPMHTVTGRDREALTAVHIQKYFGGVVGTETTEPLPTITAIDHNSLVAAHLDKYFGGSYTGCGNAANDPATTITVEARHSLCAAHIAEFKGADKGQSADAPLRTITASAGEFAAVTVRLETAEGTESLGYWPQIRSLLNRYCGYSLADNEILLLQTSGGLYYISDISMRMLLPKELYAAMGFPPDYIIERDYTGKPYPKSQQVARCGNAVCPSMASAVVRANFPEWAVDICTMEELENHVAV